MRSSVKRSIRQLIRSLGLEPLATRAPVFAPDMTASAIEDDYGHWQGARRAIDESIRSNKRPLLLQRIDYTGRIAVKV